MTAGFPSQLHWRVLPVPVLKCTVFPASEMLTPPRSRRRRQCAAVAAALTVRVATATVTVNVRISQGCAGPGPLAGPWQLWPGRPRRAGGRGNLTQAPSSSHDSGTRSLVFDQLGKSARQPTSESVTEAGPGQSRPSDHASDSTVTMCRQGTAVQRHPPTATDWVGTDSSCVSATGSSALEP